ncbi:MAG: DUF1501 domain-containing protein [Pirellulaceae bacterium]|nr:DUF1501 domain-containing protein [Planctomycetaceae bacterium]HIM32071.1 DUF1501 domain-containing protein [Planctomycetota bacterium]
MERRSFLQAGTLGSLGLANLLRVAAGSPSSDKHSVILLWMRGGPSQHETWDPKPEAPVEYRGSFGAAKTNVPGLQICDLLPKSAAIMDQWSIIRSLNHKDAGHSSGDQLLFTGYPNEGVPDSNSYPSVGSIVARQLQQDCPELPAYVMIPRRVPGTDSAYLGPSCRPFETQADPANAGPFRLPNFEIPAALSVDRIRSRRDLLKSFDRLRRRVDESGEMEAVDAFQQRAWEIISGVKARAAFDLDAEPASVRERYGFMPAYKAPTPDRCGVPAWSQRLLLARRLVEAGVRLVTVDCRWWDTHVKGYETMRDGFLPRWDQAYTALIEDLAQRGLLESTMVLAWGEFGRTPRVNATGGRDHYPLVFSAAITGGGIQGGRVVGSSDSKGALPQDNPKRPQDVLATVYRHLGIDTRAHYLDQNGRPVSVLPFGEPIDELF